jgi:hypothetical protein
MGMASNERRAKSTASQVRRAQSITSQMPEHQISNVIIYKSEEHNR